MTIAEFKKAVAAGIGSILMVATTIAQYGTGFLPGSWLAVVNAVIAIATTAAVYLVPNRLTEQQVQDHIHKTGGTPWPTS